MMELMFLLSYITLFTGMIMATKMGGEFKGHIGAYLIISSGAFLVYGFIIVSDTPKAIDVYRGKTELKIDKSFIGNDTIVKDTIVVFKRKEAK